MTDLHIHVMLTEFQPYASVDEVEQAVKKLLSRKYVPVVAHAERCDAFENAESLKRLVAADCLLQVKLK